MLGGNKALSDKTQSFFYAKEKALTFIAGEVWLSKKITGKN